jgi:hypothetical protein
MSILLWINVLILLFAAFVKLARPSSKSQATTSPTGGGSAPGQDKLTATGAVVFFSSFWAAVYLAFHAGAFFFLAYLYGVVQVWNENLYFVKMPKGQPWEVSNGDLITDRHYVQFLFAAPLIVAFFFLFYAIAAQISPWPLFRSCDGKARH